MSISVKTSDISVFENNPPDKTIQRDCYQKTRWTLGYLTDRKKTHLETAIDCRLHLRFIPPDLSTCHHIANSRLLHCLTLDNDP